MVTSKKNSYKTKIDIKPYDPSKTDLALTPPQKEWTKEALDARLQKHADAVEKATAGARESSIEDDVEPSKRGDLSSFGFNEKSS